MGQRKGVRIERQLAMIGLLLCLLPAALAQTLEPGQIHTPRPTIELTYSEAVEITGGQLLDAAGLAVRDYGAGDFTEIEPTIHLLETGLLTAGRYELAIEKREAAPPHDPLETDIVRFEYVTSQTGLDIALDGENALAFTPAESSPTGEAVLATRFATTAPYAVSLTTTLPADCRYSLFADVTDPAYMAAVDETGGTSHRITGLTARETSPLIVWCDANGEEAARAFTVGYEGAPSISASLDPPLIVDPLRLRANLSVAETDGQRLFCTAAGDGATLSSAPGLTPEDAGAYTLDPWIGIIFASTPAQRTTEEFLLTCRNRAGLETSERVTVTIDLEQEASIDQVAPAAYAATASPLVQARVIRAGQPVSSARCSFTSDGPGIAAGDPLESQDGTLYAHQLSALEDGAYALAVACVIADGQEARGSIDFVVDTTPPPARQLTAPAFICGDRPLTATVNRSRYTDEDPHFSGYDYAVGFSQATAALESGFSADGDLVASLETLPNETYKWRVTPVDLAGNEGAELAALTEVLPPGGTRCDDRPPTGYADTLATLTGTIVTVACVDGESGCMEDFRYDTPENGTGCSYTRSERLGRNLTFYENATLCFLVEDRNRNNDTGRLDITVDAPIPNATEHCANGLLDDGLEADVDCGGHCPTACALGADCSVDTDCAGGHCDANGSCAAASCLDGVMNGRETDVDCGGPACPACPLGAGCTGSGDCALNASCEEGSCTPLPDPEECASILDCAADESCEEGVCVAAAPAGCARDDDCRDSEYCAAGACIPGSGSGCTLDSDCPFGQFCKAGQCAEGSGSGCDFDSDCADGEHCLDGACIAERRDECAADSDCAADEECEAGSCIPLEEGPSLLGLLLILLGLALMGGSGYWLYTLHQERQRFAAPPTQPGLTPQQQTALARQRREQSAALKRRPAHSPQPRPPTGGAAGRRDKEAAPPTEEFVDIRDLGSGSRRYTEESRLGPVERQDAFGDLDRVLQEHPEEGAFERLDEVIGTKKRGAAKRSGGEKGGGPAEKREGGPGKGPEGEDA